MHTDSYAAFLAAQPEFLDTAEYVVESLIKSGAASVSPTKALFATEFLLLTGSSADQLSDGSSGFRIGDLERSVIPEQFASPMAADLLRRRPDFAGSIRTGSSRGGRARARARRAMAGGAS